MAEASRDLVQWLETLDPQRVAEVSAATGASWGQSLDYAVAPARHDASTLSAQLAFAHHGRRGSNGVMVLLQVDANGVRAACDRCLPPFKYCEHIPRFIADLGASTKLRQALIAGSRTDHLLAELADARAEMARRLELTRALDAWTIPDLVTDSLSIELSFGFAPTWSYSSMEHGLGLRFRGAGRRRMLTWSELHALRLSPELHELLALCDPDPSNKKAFLVLGARAGLALEMFRQHAEWGIQGARIASDPLRLHLIREPVVRNQPASEWDPPSQELDDDLDDLDALRRGRSIDHALLRSSHGRPARRPELRAVDGLVAHFRNDDGTVDVAARQAILLPGPRPFVWLSKLGRFHPLHPSVSASALARLCAAPTLAVSDAPWDGVERTLRARLGGSGIVLPTRTSLGLPELEVPSLVARIDGAALDVHVLLEATYGSGTVPLSPAAPEAGDRTRHEAVEQAAMARLQTAGLTYDPGEKCFVARDDAAAAFWQRGLAALRADASPPLQIFVSDRLAGVRVRSAGIARVRVALSGPWLDTQISFEADDVEAEMAALREALRRKRRWVLLRDGTLAELQATTASAVEEAMELVDARGHARLAPHALGLLDHWADTWATAELDEAATRLRARWRSLDVRAAELPAKLDATLRPYQRDGLAWFQFLTELGAGGILADDMGLGKTLMLLAHLARRKEVEGARPSLVICPTSVVGNWLREAARFTPGLRTLSLAGADRAGRQDHIEDCDLAVTTYALLRLDVDRLAEIDFRAVVLDEAQNIKNAGTATTQAARRLRGEQRLALTGTPVENRLGELWSILDFTNPGMLGSERSFQARFEKPIAQDPRCRAASELRARVRPFVLRRTKAQVLSDLPAKEEIDVACLPGPEQRTAYDALASLLRQDVERGIRAKGLAQSGLLILTALLRLRQMCCDPRLVDPSRPAEQSAKREAFLDLVKNLVAEGRRALVFSQFVELFTLWRQDLEREGIAYEYLDGRTLKRDDVVARFQNGSAPLFLLSLKAGGSGLNLTAADTVIHCDPWWNPAVEDQATDRAHRIGQQRPVTVYRLLLRGTIEEKIAELKTRKRALADAVVHADMGALRGLAESDVRALLGDVVEDDGATPELANDGARASGCPVTTSNAALSTASRVARPPPDSQATPAFAAPTPTIAEERPTSAAAAGAANASEKGTRPGLVRDGPAPDLATTDVVAGEDLTRLREDVLAHLRREGVSQKAFAAAVNVSQPTVSRLLTGLAPSLRAEIATRMRAYLTGDER